MRARKTQDLLSAWIVASAALIVSCSEDAGDGRGFLGGRLGVVTPCPTTDPVCADSGSPPTYVADLEPILAARCTGCHGPGGESADYDLSTYAKLEGKQKPKDPTTRAQTALGRVRDCVMPPPPLQRLTDAEVSVFYCWYKGGQLEQ